MAPVADRTPRVGPVRSRPGPAASLLVPVVTLALVGGCSTGPATIGERTGSPSAAPTTDARAADRTEALRTKFAFYLRDGCATADPAQVFPQCGRFVTEIRNTLPQVRRDAPEAAGPAEATEAALDRFTADGCEGTPGALGAGDAASCGPALARVQQEVRDLGAAVAG